MFRITVLGSSAAMPSRERGLPSVALEREGELLLFDCGEGTQRQLISAKLSKYQPDVILISHIHGDHVLGIFGLLLSMSLHDRREPVVVIGPKEVKELLDYVFSKLNSRVSYDIQFREVRQGIVMKRDEYTIRAIRASHQGDCYSYRLDEKERPGKFYPEKAKALEIPMGPLWQKLQHGKSIVIKGRRISPEEVVGPSRKGRSFGYSGDTRTTKRLCKFFEGVDILLFDSTYSDDYSREAKKFGHSTASDAAKLASEAKVGMLVLTHISQRVGDTKRLLEEAKKYHLRCVVANDFDQFYIPLHR